MTAPRALALVALSLALATLAACGSARRGPPAQPLAFSPEASRGQTTFMRYCHACHPGGEAGLGFALNNKPLSGGLIAFQVRHGLGAMPAFPAEVIPDPELDDLVVYLVELRRSR